MREDIQAGRLPVEMRPTSDIDRLLRDRRYVAGVLALKVADFAARPARSTSSRLIQLGMAAKKKIRRA